MKIPSILKTATHQTFGIDPTKNLTRNAVATILVMAPNIPTYFIPSYSEAVKTGSAKNVKKNEGLRGILTGGMDGAAAGALTAIGQKITFKRIAVFTALGMVIDWVASKVLSNMGKSVGITIYRKNRKNELQKPQRLYKQA